MLPDYIFENDVLFFVACLAKKIFLNLIFFFFFVAVKVIGLFHFNLCLHRERKKNHKHAYDCLEKDMD